MKWQPVVFAVALLLLFSLAASAEFYQYKDKDGILRYTDDATLIPEEQLSDVITHESVRTEPPEEGVAEQPADFYQEESGATPGMHEASADEPAEDVTEAGVGAPPLVAQDKMEKRKEYDELNAMREELQKAYQELEAEKKAVGPPPPPGAKTGEMADYVQKRRELEQKIEAYNKKSETFDENVKAFNRGAMQ